MFSHQPSAISHDRYSEVARVLGRVLILNLAIALAKIGFGYASGAISILSDGFHSLTDSASNIVGLIGIRAAGRPPDDDHPYGHRKYETVAAAAVTVFLALLVIEVLRNAFNHLTGRSELHEISTASFVVMLVTVGVNLGVVAYESRAAARLGSEVLLADAMQTRGDVWSSLTVIGALVGARLGVPILDPLAALVVAEAGGRAGVDRDAFQCLRIEIRIVRLRREDDARLHRGAHDMFGLRRPHIALGERRHVAERDREIERRVVDRAEIGVRARAVRRIIGNNCEVDLLRLFSHA
jgi:hypothetical protein